MSEPAAASKIAFREAVEGGRQLTYAALAEQSARMADLYRRHDLRAEDRAAMIVLDRIEFPIIFWGSIKAGIIPVPLNTLLSPDYYEIILNDSRARALFVSAELLPVVEPLLPRLTFSEDGVRGRRRTQAATSPLPKNSRRARHPRWSKRPRTLAHSGSIPPARPGGRRACATSMAA